MTQQSKQAAINAAKQAVAPEQIKADAKAWARKIVARKAANERVSPCVHAMALRALGLEV
jgi:hypothetical protein